MTEWTDEVDAVRVRLLDDWPEVDPARFREALSAAEFGKRLPSLADNERIRAELDAAPIAPVEDVEGTVTAQLEALISAQ